MTFKASLRQFVKYSVDVFQFALGNKALWRDNDGRRERVIANWGGVFSQPDFKEKFLKLIKGLDDKSISTVVRVLTTQKKVLASNKKFLDLYTKDEQRKLRELKDNFYDQVLQISDDLFAYKHYLLPNSRVDAPVFYYKYGINEVETIDRVKGKAIIDAGGFIGDTALFFEELDPEKIYTFEPLPANFELIKKTIELNGLKNVVAENMAVGAEKGEFTLYVAGKYLAQATGSSGIVKRDGVHYQKEIKIPETTLDDYVAEHKIENVGLIKADVEGAEPMLLAGAKKTICEQKPILLICIYHNAHDFFEIKPMIESWNLGYRFKIYKPIQGGDTALDTLLIAEVL